LNPFTLSRDSFSAKSTTQIREYEEVLSEISLLCASSSAVERRQLGDQQTLINNTLDYLSAERGLIASALAKHTSVICLKVKISEYSIQADP
jgi:hypothetical protein